MVVVVGVGERETHSLAGHIGMPNLGLEAHLGGLKWVAVGNLNIDLVLAAGVGRVRRRGDHASKMAQVDAVTRCGKDTRVVLIGLHVGELLDDAAISAGRHGGFRSSFFFGRVG